MIKLLIADDEKTICQTISTQIPWDTLGVEVIGTAQNGMEAYDIILDEYPDIVITDIKMPGLSGLELLQRIKKINEDVEFIILSGYGEFDYAREAMQWGVRHYLLKPCNEEQIMESVREVMEDIAKKRAKKSRKSEQQQLDNMMMLNIINEGAAYEEDGPEADYSSVYGPYRKFLDFTREPYELCYLYFVGEGSMEDGLQVIRAFQKRAAPGITFYTLYVRQTLLFFFRSYRYDYEELDRCMEGLKLPGQEVTCQYSRTPYGCLDELLNTVIRKIRRYETIYYDNSGMLVTLFNYRGIIRKAEALTAALYDEDGQKAQKAFLSLTELLSTVTDPVFLKQLISSVLMLSASKAYSYSVLKATEFLMAIGPLTDCGDILGQFRAQLEKILSDYRSQSSMHGALSCRVSEYVTRNLSDADLSLKQIAENYLYMNVDYVSKRFFKETGQKFSNYLTNLRIEKAKQLLADSDSDKILSIAEMVGCGNNPKYFSQLFKKATGMTPSGYIKYISGGNTNGTTDSAGQN